MKKKTLGERAGRDLYTLEEVAEFLRMAPKTLYNKRLLGQGPKSIKVGARVLYDYKDVVDYLDSCELDAA